MTLTQLEYLVAIDTYGSFLTAAEHCHVTQPSLSMQVQKLEKELGVRIFDRSRQPVVATETGMLVIEQAREILKECGRLKELVQETKKGDPSGELRLGIIPTLAPYVLPLFLAEFLRKYPKVTLKISELTTAQIIQHLKSDQLDCGLLVTPVETGNMHQYPLFYEPLIAYVSEGSSIYHKRVLEEKDIDPAETWILNEGHCLRSQVLNLCNHKNSQRSKQFQYQTGSLETLKKMVEMNKGITILPELSIMDFSDEQMERVRYFKKPEPVREVSLIMHRVELKKQLATLLMNEILEVIPAKMKKKKDRNVVEIEQD